MSIDPVPQSLREVWDSKQRADEDTRGMSRKELIRYYREKADEAERRLGLKLERQPASKHETPSDATR
jgi:hypothetical protein